MFKKFKSSQITQKQLANIKGGVNQNNCKEAKTKNGDHALGTCHVISGGSSHTSRHGGENEELQN